MASCIVTVYLALCGGGIAVAAMRAAAPPQTSTASSDPDALYRHREDISSAKKAVEIWAARAADGKHFEASWKLARACYWLGKNAPDKERRAFLGQGLDAANQAIALEPNKPEGHFWAAANMGQIAETSSIFSRSKYKDDIKKELETVIQMSPGWQAGSAESAIGQWYHEVPGWLGGDDVKGIEWLRKAVAYDKDGTQSRLALALVLADDKKTRDEAKALLQKVIDLPVDPEWAPEDRQNKAQAAELLAKLSKK
jgi:tetratricopeptide (TPR) repeat protein